MAGETMTTQQTRLARMACMACMAPVARLWVRLLLAEFPCTRDAELIASELVSNTLRYGRGPEFTVTVAIEPGRARLAVIDSRHLTGTQTHDASEPSRIPEPAHGLNLSEDEPDTGHDLQVVNALASRWGHILDSPETLWAELSWSPVEPAACVPTPSADARVFQ